MTPRISQRDKILSKSNVSALSNAFWSLHTYLDKTPIKHRRTRVEGMSALRCLFDEIQTSHIALNEEYWHLTGEKQDE